VAALGGEGNASLRSGVPKGADFLAFWTAGALLADGEPEAVYSPTGIPEKQRAFFPRRWKYRGLYPPPIYQAFEAAQPLGYRLAVLLWLLGGALLVALGGAFIADAVGLGGARRAAAIVAAGAGPFAIMNLLTGQAAGLWLVLLGGGILLLRRGRPLLAGIVLGLLCTKPQYGAVAALWLLLGGQWRAIGGFVLGGASLVGASVAWGGLEPWLAWLTFLGGDFLQGFAPVPFRNISLPALITVPFRGWAPAATLSKGLSLFGLAGTLWVARGLARRSPSDDRWPLHAGLVLSALLVSLPHMMDYDLGLHGLLLLGAAPWIDRRNAWLYGAVLVVPLLGEVGRWTRVPVGPLILIGWLGAVAARRPWSDGHD
jgi:alpha-1,2-mannosyltransferase